MSDYWKARCLAAEEYIKEDADGPHMSLDQREAYNKWQELVNKEPETRKNIWGVDTTGLLDFTKNAGPRDTD